MRRIDAMLFVCAAACLAAVGCRSAESVADLQFDARGWGGPNLKYKCDEKAGTMELAAGMLVNRDFRWADSEFSLEFRDSRDVIWGVRLLDFTFYKQRTEKLPEKRVKIGDRSWTTGPELTPEQRAMLDMDRAFDMQFLLDEAGKSYKILAGWWYEKILDDQGRQGLRVEAAYDTKVREGMWNTLRIVVQKGRLTYYVNDAAGVAPLDIDSRLNGRVGFYVQSGGPLQIRNLRFGPVVKPAAP